MGFAKPVLYVIFIAAILIFQMSAPAHAYLDPGTGTMLLQGIIAAVGATLGAFYYYFDRIKQFFGLQTRKSDDLSAKPKVEREKIESEQTR